MECLIYAAIVILTVVVVWIPWLGSYHDFSSVLTAIFPVHRGLYQLKVPNFWCISDVVIKW
jgi:alpha-1,3-glucosyltransferase